LNPRDVDIPSPLVDYITVAPKEYHWQAGNIEYDPRISYKVVPPITNELIKDVIKRPSNQYEKVIARKILLELVKVIEEKGGPVLVNLGIGIPAFVSSVISEEDISEFIVTVLESGIWGGIALSGVDFGLAISPFAISTIPDMFSNFEGGIIDAASLGFLQIDKQGNVNPSVLPDRIFGPGGFPVIAGGAPRTYFAGAFTAGQSKLAISDNKLQIIQDGSVLKFVDSVLKVVFSGHQAVKYMHKVLYVTERAVFRLTANGLILKEIAPGVDIEKHILSKMDFKPLISSRVKEMENVLFKEGKMNIKEQVMHMIRK
jgi:acyl CoA:acetate/3-ketoacid CoA transferase